MNNSLICVDANLVIRLVIDPKDDLVKQLWQKWLEQGYQLAAPTLLYYEVTNALYRYQKHNMLTETTVKLALNAALALPLQLYGYLELHQKASALAHSLNLSATYDAHYLALAQYLNAEFWTADKRLVNSVKPQLAWVHLVDG